MANIKTIQIKATGLLEIKRELDEVKKALKETSDPKEMAKLTEQADKLQSQLKEVNDSIKDIETSSKKFSLDKTLEEVNNGTVSLSSGISQLEDELARLYHTGQENTEEFKEMNQAAADLRSSISDVNRQTDLLGANDAPQQIALGWRNVGASLKNLDFATASRDAKQLETISKNISFKTATTSLQNLGKTFISLGKSLLTNPIFLLAAVIVGIVAAVYKLLDSLGFIKTAIDSLMKPIQYLIDLFYKLTDSIGLTNKAAQKAAEEKAQAYEESANRIESANNKIVASLDHEIRMARLNGEDTVELERRKVKALEETALARLRADAAAWQAAKLNKSLSEEEVKELEGKARASQAAYFQMRNDVEYFEASVLKTEQENYNKRLSEAERFAKERRDAEKRYNEDRISAARLEEDLKLELMEDGFEKELLANKLRYERLIEDTRKNESLKEEEKDRIINYYEDLRAQKEEEIYQERLKVIEEFNEEIFNLTANSTEKQIASLEEAHREELLKYRELLDNKLISLEDYNRAREALEIQLQENLKEIASGEEELSLEEEYEQKLSKQREYFESGLIDEEEFINRRSQLETEYQEKIKQQDEELANSRRENFSNYLSIASDGINAISSLMSASMDAEIQKAEGNEKKQEALRKKAFEQQKKMQIASAFINMAQGIIAGLGAPFPMNIAMPIIAGATGMANIAKIKNQKYSGGGGSPSMPTSTPSLDTGSSSERVAPTINFEKNRYSDNEQRAGGNSTLTIENNIRVSETEITDKQHTVANLMNQSQL